MGTKKKYSVAIACLAILCAGGILYVFLVNSLCNFENPPRLLKIQFSESDIPVDLELVLIMRLKNGSMTCPYSDVYAKALVKHDPEGFFSRPSLLVKNKQEIAIPLSDNAAMYVLLVQNRNRKNNWDGFYQWEISSVDIEKIKGASILLPPVESIPKFGFRTDHEVLWGVFEKANK